MIRLDIFSDPVCPWCYIGKTLLDRALERHPDHPFAVEWHPFRLNPDMPPGGLPAGHFFEHRFGGREKVASILAQTQSRAAQAGVEIDFTRVTRMPDTLDAHRLIHWAGLEGRQNAVVTALFRAYFRDGQDIGDAATLAAIAGAAGLDAVAIGRLLATDADRDAIIARDTHARERGVQAVPTFILADQYVLSGAQPPEIWDQVITELNQQ